MSSVVVKIDRYIYEPSYDTETGDYIDICPYKKHERNRKMYQCNCKAGSLIHSIPSFNSHIKSECHRNYLINYDVFKKELNEEKEKNKHLIYEKEMLIRKINKQEQDYKGLEEKYDKLVEQNRKFHEKSGKLLNKYKKILDEITVD